MPFPTTRPRALLFSLLCLVGLLGGCQTVEPPSPSAPVSHEPAIIPTSDSPDNAQAFVRAMGIGWNLGNTMESCGDWINKGSIQNFETAWGAPVTTKAMFDGIKAAGFRSVRIPVAWSNLMGSNDTINSELMERIGEIVNYALADDLYVVVNLHWDGGWLAQFPTATEESMAHYLRIWTQVSDTFKNVSTHLIFESLNEEGGWDSVWNRWSGKAGPEKQRSYALLNTINQKFVDLVRSSGGKNATRFLLIAGYNTDIDLTVDPLFQMPSDPAGHSIVSVHYYTPSTFTILEADADWGKKATTWGTDADKAVVESDFSKLKVRFVDQGIPVIVGEYGATRGGGNDPASVRAYVETVAKTAVNKGLCPMLWDIDKLHYNRSKHKFDDAAMAEMFLTLGRSL